MSTTTSFSIIGDNRNVVDGGHLTQRLALLLDQNITHPSRRSPSPPPPYSLSGTPTNSEYDSDNPVPPLPDDAERIWQENKERRRKLAATIPSRQFNTQVERLRDQFSQQDRLLLSRRDVPEFLKYNEKLDYLSNAENIVRARWVEQGIWKEWWGPAWPNDAKPADNFSLKLDYRNEGKCPYIWGAARWGHELEKLEQDKPKKGEVVVDASRPFEQFQSQIKDEVKWLQWRAKIIAERDGQSSNFAQSGSDAETLRIGSKGYENIKQFWVEHNIWNEEWREIPGMSWIHADLLDAPAGHFHPPAPDVAVNLSDLMRSIVHSMGLEATDGTVEAEEPDPKQRESRAEAALSANRRGPPSLRTTNRRETTGVKQNDASASRTKRGPKAQGQRDYTTSRKAASKTASQQRTDPKKSEPVARPRRQSRKGGHEGAAPTTLAASAPRRSARNVDRARPDYNPPAQKSVEISSTKRKRNGPDLVDSPTTKRRAGTAQVQNLRRTQKKTASSTRSKPRRA